MEHLSIDLWLLWIFSAWLITYESRDHRFFGDLTDEIAAKTGGWPVPTAELDVP